MFYVNNIYRCVKTVLIFACTNVFFGGAKMSAFRVLVKKTVKTTFRGAETTSKVGKITCQINTTLC